MTGNLQQVAEWMYMFVSVVEKLYLSVILLRREVHKESDTVLEC